MTDGAGPRTPTARRRALRELLHRAATLPHSGRSFLAHLVGTYDVLVAWHQPATLCAAGLLHSVYATESYPHALVPRDHRDHVRAIVGGEAERLAYAFCTIDRAALWRLHAARAPRDLRTLRVPTHEGGVARLDARDARCLVLVECANLAEQCRAPDDGPAPWMARVLAGWRTLLQAAPAPPPYPIAERRSIASYRYALEAASRRVARASLDRAISDNPYAAEPHLLRALCVDSAAESARSARRGARLLAAWGVAWDKRLPIAAWRAVAARARGRRSAHDFEAVVSALATRRLPRWLRSAPRRAVAIALP